MRYPPVPYRPRQVGRSMPLPTRLPPGYDEALRLARRDIRAYRRHSQLYQAFGPIPRHMPALPTGRKESIVTTDVDHPKQTHGGTIVLTVVGVLVLIMALGFGIGSLATPSVVEPSDTSYSVVGSPSVSADFIDRVLTYYGSPAAGHAQALYDLGVKYNIDPIFALAFFMHESSFGKTGMATTTLGLGNERCIQDRPCINTEGSRCESDQSCYAQFSSWEDGFEHWYLLITGPLYEGSGLTTVALIIPRYAPSADHNNEAGYIAAVENAVTAWRKGVVAVS